MARGVVGIEFDAVHRLCAGRFDYRDLFTQFIAAARREDDGAPRSDPPRYFKPDFAAPAEHQHRPRVEFSRTTPSHAPILSSGVNLSATANHVAGLEMHGSVIARVRLCPQSAPRHKAPARGRRPGARAQPTANAPAQISTRHQQSGVTPQTTATPRRKPPTP
ncbi:hypothetical protein FMUBM48_34090 [Nocardia cyriacigeorgica]|nr:hypothetical protein FMUBM48_34090 [Nocardia cyriacigeorgica]